MANNKTKIIDKLNRAFEEASTKFIAREYTKNINAIQKEAIALFEKNEDLTQSDLRAIINNNRIDVAGFKKIAFMQFILASLTLVISNIRTLSRKDRLALEPILILLGLLKTSKNIKLSKIKPTKIANDVSKLTNAIIKGHKPTKLTPTQQNAFVELDKYFKKNEKVINKIALTQQKAMRKINKKITTNISKSILKDLRRFKVIDKQIATFEQVKEKLRSKYRNASVRVERILRTEMHATSETTKLIQARNLGFTHKTWTNNPTAGKGGPVRGTQKGDKFNHKMLNGKTIPIDSKFKLVGGKAEMPGSQTLPAGDRIYCRCTLVYSRK